MRYVLPRLALRRLDFEPQLLGDMPADKPTNPRML
jgi:hypothetical protein